MLEQIKSELKIGLQDYFQKTYRQSIDIVVEEPKDSSLGDLSIPLFQVVKKIHKPLMELVAEAVEFLRNFSSMIQEVSSIQAFINIKLNEKKFSQEVLKEILTKKEKYGDNNIGNHQKIVLDYSSPNIAKSFSVGHLRSTMIGNSLRLIFEKCGYETYSINYLGDWGIQFGKMIVAFQKWGNKETILKNPIEELTNLYVRFHKESETDLSLEDEAKEAFHQMEIGNPEYIELWRWIREESLKESAQIYDLLEVSFDSFNGEAFYNDKMAPVIKELREKHLLVEDQGEWIVRLGDDIVPARIVRNNGASFYITRDLTAVLYRKKEYQFTKMLYVVGNEQKLHFTQLKRLVERMGYDFAPDIEHINMGFYLYHGKKMSSRNGQVVKLYDALQQAIGNAEKLISEKNPTLNHREEIARKVGVAAIVFNDLKTTRSEDVEFDLEQCVKFEGQTGPYLQYTGVRIASILKGNEIEISQCDWRVFEKPHYFDLVKKVSLFESIIQKAAKDREPSVIARYLLSLAQSFNSFYSMERINVEEVSIRMSNFAIAYATRVVLNEGLRLLGIHYLDEM